MYRLDLKRLFLLSALAGLLLLLLRGCIGAGCEKRPTPQTAPSAPDLPDIILTMYYADEDRRVTLGLEEYIAGVVAAEMPISYAAEALKAQAVAARTFALRKIAHGGCDSGCDICSDSGCCQAYDSVEVLQKRWGANFPDNTEKLHAAVSATAGEALFYEGALIEALYHAASGGATEDSQHVFSTALPYLTSVSSENEVGSSNLQNTETYSRRSFEKAVNAAFPNVKIQRDKLEEQVEVLARFPSGRVETLRLGAATVTGRAFREALELRSAQFTIVIEKDEVQVETRGYGHGVGMSQTGANGMAQKGADYRAILTHYYTGVEIAAYYQK